ncbi:MAG: DUF2796 domain-containing protein [Pseudomonadaceae bacterium]|nr:DUF2796 domain-containing protein [Pseudomonadaceae bacterium]
MRRLLLALPFALLPLAAAQAADDEHAHEHAEHSSLAAHQHGAAQLNVALDGNTLELALESPTMNIVGFEHAAVSASDQAAAAKAKQQLQDPLALFSIVPGANCRVTKLEVASQVFAAATAATNNASVHSDVDADYALTCSHPELLQGIDLSELFKRFPATQKIQVQLIGPKGQQGGELSPANPRLNF